MFKKLIISFGIVLSLMIPSIYANAQSSRVGVINLDRILTESNIAKASEAKLEREFTGRQKGLEEQARKLQSMLESYQKNQITLSESQRLERENEIRRADEQFAKLNGEFQRDLNNRRAQELQVLLDKANEAVRKVAQSEKFDLILSEAVFAKPEYDITDKVLSILNK